MAKLVIVKILLVLATINGWFLVQLDANNVFLHNDLAKEVYMCLPLGYHHEKSSKGISVSQRHYALQILFDIGFLACKPASTPMEANVKL
ncbi:hypothetical protein AAG906_022030 [Vitis piasezkii]